MPLPPCRGECPTNPIFWPQSDGCSSCAGGSNSSGSSRWGFYAPNTGFKSWPSHQPSYHSSSAWNTSRAHGIDITLATKDYRGGCSPSLPPASYSTRLFFCHIVPIYSILGWASEESGSHQSHGSFCYYRPVGSGLYGIHPHWCA